MKKEVGFVLVLVLMASFVVAGISLSEPLDIYNLGDRLYVSAEGLIGAESGNLNVDLICGNRTVNLEKMSARRYDSGEAFPYSLPYKILNLEDLEIGNLSDVVGECQVVLSLGANVASTKTFTISDNIDVVAYLDKASYDPTEAITVGIDAVKDNGALLNGFVEGGNITAFSKVIENGFVKEVFSVPETIEAGIYYLTLRVYDGRNSVLNEGTMVLPVVINQVASSINVALSGDAVTPGEGFSIGAEVFDQSGIKMDGTVSIKFMSTLSEEVETSVQSGEFVDVNFASNASVGAWRIISSFNNLSSEREFEMLAVQAVEFVIEDGVLSVRNVGNVLYNKSISVEIGEEERELNLNIDVGEVRKFALAAPTGEYDVVVEDGGSYLSRQVLLTGKAVAVEDLKDVGIFRGYSIIWVFLIVVLGAVGLLFFMKYRKTKTLSSGDGIMGGEGRGAGFVGKMAGKIRGKFGKNVPGKIKSHVADSMHFTNKSPAVQGLDSKSYSHEDSSMVDLTKRSVGSAESTLVLKGEKYVSAVISLSIKNHGKLSDVAKNALHKAVAGAQKKRGLVDWRGDYIFVVFSPIVTKTYKNEALAVKIGQEILEELSGYNKKFKDKIEFGLGVHVGELIASKVGEKLKYTSIGNTISLAKRISDSDSEKLIVSDEIRKKLLRDLKVEKGKEVGGNQSYVVSEIKDKSGDAARLQELLKRQS